MEVDPTEDEIEENSNRGGRLIFFPFLSLISLCYQNGDASQSVGKEKKRICCCSRDFFLINLMIAFVTLRSL